MTPLTLIIATLTAALLPSAGKSLATNVNPNTNQSQHRFHWLFQGSSPVAEDHPLLRNKRQLQKDVKCMDNGQFYRDPDRQKVSMWSTRDCGKYYLCVGTFPSTIATENVTIFILLHLNFNWIRRRRSVRIQVLHRSAVRHNSPNLRFQSQSWQLRHQFGWETISKWNKIKSPKTGFDAGSKWFGSVTLTVTPPSLWLIDSSKYFYLANWTTNKTKLTTW